MTNKVDLPNEIKAILKKDPLISEFSAQTYIQLTALFSRHSEQVEREARKSELQRLLLVGGVNIEVNDYAEARLANLQQSNKEK